MQRRSLLPTPFGGFATPSLRQGGDPFLALHREMNRLFDEAFRGFGLPEGESGAGFAAGGVVAPRIDVSETEQELKVYAELPGVDQKDVDITLTDDVLTIRGEKKVEREDQQQNYHVMERSYGSFARSIRLPFQANPDQVQATFKDGVLSVTMPKPAEVQQKERRIQISGGGQEQAAISQGGETSQSRDQAAE
jgi:HSP20 family protein